MPVADGVERLDDARVGEPALHLLAAGVGVPEGQRRRCIGREHERIGRVDDDLAGQVPGAGQAEGVLGAAPQRREDRDLGERRRLRERPGRGACAGLLDPTAHLLVARFPRADLDLVTARREAGAERASDVPSPQNSDPRLRHGCSSLM